MRIFVTGATGFVGSAVVKELISAGHHVIGLARSEESAKSLIEIGAESYMGNIEQPESLQNAVAEADGVIHTAFNHDFSRFKENCESDRRVIEMLGETLVGTDKHLVITSGIGILPKGHIVTEETMPIAGPLAHPRAASEEAADVVARRGVKVSVVRLSPSVHGDGDHGFIPILINIARQKGISVYAGEGNNHWPAIHRLDAAHLFRLVLEQNFDGGARYHGVAEEAVPFRDIAEVIGRRLNVPIVSKSPEEAVAHFAWFAHFAAMDIHASSAKTQLQLAWNPRQADLLTDIDRPEYFAT